MVKKKKKTNKTANPVFPNKAKDPSFNQNFEFDEQVRFFQLHAIDYIQIYAT